MVTFELTTVKQEYLGTYLKNKALNLVDYTIRTCNLINTTHRTTYLEQKCSISAQIITTETFCYKSLQPINCTTLIVTI